MLIINMDFILEIENNLPIDVCNEMVDKFEKDENKEIGKVGKTDYADGFVDLKLKDNFELGISDFPDNWGNIVKILEKCLKNGLDLYKNYLGDVLKLYGCESNDIISRTFNSVIDEGYEIQRVQQNGWYRWHYDALEKSERLLTCIWYLNTIDPDIGGRTDFINGRRVSAKCGKLLLFPATWTHIHSGSFIKSGTKYICVTNIRRPDN